MQLNILIKILWLNIHILTAHQIFVHSNMVTICCITRVTQKSKFEPTNETRNSDKTLRMMSPIHYGIAPSILVWWTYIYSVQYWNVHATQKLSARKKVFFPCVVAKGTRGNNMRFQKRRKEENIKLSAKEHFFTSRSTFLIVTSTRFRV